MIDNEVAILMTIYKEPIDFLNQSIKSILNQTYKNFIFFIGIDNPQYEAAIDLVIAYSKLDERIRVVVNDKNLGLPKALNKLLEQIPDSVKFIARMDADDISIESRIEEELVYLTSNNLDLVGCTIKTIDEQGKEIPKTFQRFYDTPKKIHKVLRYYDCIPHPTWLAKKEVFFSLGGYRNIFACEDYDLLLRSDLSGYKMGLISKSLLIHRVNSAGISRQNGLLQFLTAHYLSKNRYRINTVSISEINIFLSAKINEKDTLKFERGILLLRRAKREIHYKQMSGFLNLIKGVFSSRWVFLYVIQSTRALFTGK